MIFSNEEGYSISNPQERNLYTKLFAGYIFNEFIENPSINERLASFLKIEPLFIGGQDNTEKKTMGELFGKQFQVEKIQTKQVSFDNHLIRDDNLELPGEFADIAIWIKDDGNYKLIAIEAKFTENFSLKNDIENNLKRIRGLIDKEYSVYKLRDFNVKEAIFILLLCDDKIEKYKNKTNSCLNKWLNEKYSYNIPAAIVSWESVLKSLPENYYSNIVSAYFEKSKEEMRKQNRLK